MTGSPRRLDLWRAGERALADATDLVASAVLRRPTRVRVDASVRGLVAARAEAVSIAVEDVSVGALDLASVRVHASRVRVLPGLPPHLRTGPVVVRVTVTEESLRRWMRARSMPLECARSMSRSRQHWRAASASSTPSWRPAGDLGR